MEYFPENTDRFFKKLENANLKTKTICLIEEKNGVQISRGKFLLGRKFSH